MSLRIGTLLKDRYRIDALLGEGGMGAVYRAFDRLHDQPCALKEFRLGYLPSENEPELDDDSTRLRAENKPAKVSREKAIDQFRREARLLARLDHPSLPKVRDYFSEGDDYYLVMTLIEGRGLDQLLAAARRPLAWGEAVAWVEQLLGALVYCHEQGVIHRDLKPANVIIAETGQAYLVDFGIAKPDDPASKTTLGARATTPGYSPPEQYGGQARTDGRSDIYAFGAMLYTLVTGQDPVEAIDRLTGTELEPPIRRSVGLPEAVNAAILRAMALRQADRFQTAAELKAALSLAPMEIPAPASTAQVTVQMPPPPAVAGLEAPAPAKPTKPTPERPPARELAGQRPFNVASQGGLLVVQPLAAPPKVTVSWKALPSLKGHTGEVNAVAFSADGKWIVSAADDATLRVWEGSKAEVLKGHSGAVWDALCLPDGRHMASGGEDGELFIWDRLRRDVVRDLRGHNKAILALALSSSGTMLASASADRTVAIWDLETKKLVVAYDKYRSEVNCVAFSPDERWLASGCADGRVLIWDLEQDALGCNLRHPGKFCSCLAFSPDGSWLVVGANETIHRYQTTDWRSQEPLEKHEDGVERVAFTPDGRWLGSTAADGSLRLWDTLTWTPATLYTDPEHQLVGLAFSPDGRRLAAASTDHTVHLWEKTG